MAENDRFVRRVEKPWRKACRLVKSLAEPSIIADEVVRASNQVLHQVDCSDFPRVVAILASAQEATPRASDQLPMFSANENFAVARAYVDLEQLQNQSSSEFCRLIVEEAHGVLVDIRANADPGERLAELVAWRIPNSMLFSRVRDELMKLHKWSVGDYEKWVNVIRELVRTQATKLLKETLKTGEAPKRVPARLTKKMEMTAEALNEPMVVLVSNDD